MAKGMLSLTVALLLSAMCAVEGQSAAAAGGGGGFGGPAAVAAAEAAGGGYGGLGNGGGGYGVPGYGGPGYGGSGYGGGYPNTYLPPDGQSSSYVNAAKRIKSSSGVGILDNLLNHFIDVKLLNNANG